jgi:hypothetical protein
MARRCYSSQLFFPAELRLVVAEFAKGLKFLQPKILQKSHFGTIINLVAGARAQLVYDLEGKVVAGGFIPIRLAGGFIPIRLQLFIRMAPVLKLKLMTVDQSAKVYASRHEHFVVEVVTD